MYNSGKKPKKKRDQENGQSNSYCKTKDSSQRIAGEDLGS